MKTTKEIQINQATITEEVKKSLRDKLKRAISLDKQIKSRQAELEDLKEAIEDQMTSSHLNTFESRLGRLTYVAPTERVTVDTRLLKKESPDLANKYSKIQSVKASIRIKY